MTVRIRLLAARLHYEPGLQVSTAVSKVDHLHAHYLAIDGADGFHGIGEVRANIEFLTHVPEEAVAGAIRALAAAIEWRRSPEAVLDDLPRSAAGQPASARAAVESALVDGIARRDGVSAAVTLGGEPGASWPTNQCLFWSPDEVFRGQAERYVAEGFRELKVRVAIGSFERDLARLEWLRERFGDAIAIAIDANGAWEPQAAIERLRRLEPLDLAYVEQPTPPGDWDAIRRAGDACSIPLMLDEALATDDDIERLGRLGPPFLGHVKIVKLGGPRVVVAAARRLREAGVRVMIGQMNEGAMATALTVHCAIAARPDFAELYGCYGLLDDPAAGVRYEDGAAHVPGVPGMGVAFDEARTALLWEMTG